MAKEATNLLWWVIIQFTNTHSRRRHHQNTPLTGSTLNLPPPMDPSTMEPPPVAQPITPL
ncbi:hypothetical protein Gohar_015257, partial [Gossypium harknessii]|nr:hypothetical protein [Gossypium harknessii]